MVINGIAFGNWRSFIQLHAIFKFSHYSILIITHTVIPLQTLFGPRLNPLVQEQLKPPISFVQTPYCSSQLSVPRAHSSISAWKNDERYSYHLQVSSNQFNSTIYLKAQLVENICVETLPVQWVPLYSSYPVSHKQVSFPSIREHSYSQPAEIVSFRHGWSTENKSYARNQIMMMIGYPESRSWTPMSIKVRKWKNS